MAFLGGENNHLEDCKLAPHKFVSAISSNLKIGLSDMAERS